MASTTLSMISGEKLQRSCDLFLGSDQLKPPLLRQGQRHKLIDITCDSNINAQLALSVLQKLNYNVKTVFAHVHLLHHPKWRANHLYVLRQLRQPFNLVLHNGDGNFGVADLKLFGEVPLLRHIYTQNLVLDPATTPYAERLHFLPIGIANSQFKHGNLLVWGKTLMTPAASAKSKLLYFAFAVSTNKQQRSTCQKMLHKNGFVSESIYPYEQYLQVLQQYQFAACPEGNGLDTHRFWEALYLRVIPVCLSTPLTRHFSALFPVCMVDKWEQVTPAFLEAWYSAKKASAGAEDMWRNYAMLDCRHWQQKMSEVA